MCRLFQFVVLALALLFTSFAFAEDKNTLATKAETQRTYKEFCTSNVFTRHISFGVSTGSLLVDLNFKNDSPKWNSKIEKPAMIILKNIDRSVAREMCKSKCDEHDGVGKKKLNRCIGYLVYKDKEGWECWLAREAIFTQRVTDIDPEKSCQSSLYVDISTAKILQSLKDFDDDKYFAANREHEAYVRTLNNPTSLQFNIDESIKFDKANRQFSCDGNTKRKCMEELKELLDTLTGRCCDEKVYHLLGFEKNNLNSANLVVKVPNGVSVSRGVFRNMLQIHLFKDYFTKYYKTGKKLFIDDACPQEGDSTGGRDVP